MKRYEKSLSHRQAFRRRGKPQPLKASTAKTKQIITPEKLIQKAFFAWRDVFKRQFPILYAMLWAEGQVNRLKFLQRQMDGRANFDLLRARVL